MDTVAYKPAKTGYQIWMEQEGIPVAEGYGIEDVTELPRKPWKHMHPYGHSSIIHNSQDSYVT